MNEINYPFSPKGVDIKVLKPSSDYFFEAFKVTLSVLLFILVYILLIVFSTVLAAIVSYLGIQLILLKPTFVTIMLGIGLIGLGVMVLFFLVKFIFTSRRVDRSGLFEINKSEFPELFSFIRKLARETRAPLPKRIYLSPEVNASVFYDSSFLSMFFPVKKNLMIGLGLVNSVNLSEFKAVIAHEFGHFSQHSMRLGSYVFNVNRIIYNMLYDNDSYGDAINSWANASNYFALFAKLTIQIVKFIQSILQKVYLIVNKSNLRLSRQMEHHADAVSAFVCGPKHLINALKRIEISDLSYNILLNKYETWIKQNLKPDNIYTQHSEVITMVSKQNGLDLENGLPGFNAGQQENSMQSRIIVKDQWSTHPSNNEREGYLKALNIDDVEPVDDSPWILFGNGAEVQKAITAKLFSVVKYEGAIENLNFIAFKQKIYDEYNKSTFNKEYNGFYNNRRIKAFDLNLSDDKSETNKSFEELFSHQNYLLTKKLEVINSDLQLLKNMNVPGNQIHSFEFDGVKCKIDDVPGLIEQLEKEIKPIQNQIDGLDKEIFLIAMAKSDSEIKENLIKLYADYFRISAECESGYSNYTKLANEISPIYSTNISIENATLIMARAKEMESQIIQQIKEVMPEAQQEQYIENEQFKRLEKYLKINRRYLYNNGFNNEELYVLNEAMNIFLNLISEREFRFKKKMLNMQMDIFNAIKFQNI